MLKSFKFINLSKQGQNFCSLQLEPKKANKEIEKFDYIYGINPVISALHSSKRKLEQLFINQNQEAYQTNPRISNIIDHANKIRLPIKMISKSQIESYAGSGQPHQNIILKCSPRKFLRIQDMSEVNSKVNIFLDQVTDPQNFGSIIRTAFFLGVDGFIVEEKNRCPLTPTISKVSSGAMEMIDIHCTRQSAQFFKRAKEEGYVLIGTGMGTSKKQFSTNDNLSELIKGKKFIVIFGSESQGMSPYIVSLADFMINIPQGPQRKFPETLIDSLNVGVSAGIILNHLINQANQIQI